MSHALLIFALIKLTTVSVVFFLLTLPLGIFANWKFYNFQRLATEGVRVAGKITGIDTYKATGGVKSYELQGGANALKIRYAFDAEGKNIEGKLMILERRVQDIARYRDAREAPVDILYLRGKPSINIIADLWKDKMVPVTQYKKKMSIVPACLLIVAVVSALSLAVAVRQDPAAAKAATERTKPQ